MSILELSKFVEVFHIIFTKVHTVFEIEASDMILNILSHFFPGMLGFSDQTRQTKGCGVLSKGLLDDCSIMHEFLGDASNIDTCSTKTPLSTCWTWLHIIQNCNLLGTLLHSLLTCGQTTTATSNHYQVIIILMTGIKSIIDHGDFILTISFILGGTEFAAKIKCIITTTNESQYILGNRFGGGTFGGPDKGGGCMFMRSGVGNFITESTVNQPITVVVTAVKIVIDNLETGGEECGE
mmetsp:Transcript_29207/g.44590  ORF Transcript_29207/g.44590 Transcript_29207/m.44590 type:complete len:238 (+) Transcript_29207:1532-2245(+)